MIWGFRMQRFVKKYLYVHSQPSSLRLLVLYILIAFVCTLAVRLLLWYHITDVDAFWLEGSPLPIYSPDAGLYGYYAKQLLAGASYPFVSEYMPGYLIYFLVSTFHLNIDWVMFLLPAFLASLVVIPIILMGYAVGLLRVGFYAALIGGIGINFYTRSHLGYMDTDTLNLFFPYFGIAAMLLALQRRSYFWGIVFLVALGGFYYWYHSSLVIIAALIAVAVLITPFILKNRRVTILSAIIMIAALFTVDYSKVSQRAHDYFSAEHAITLKGAHETYRFTNTLGTVSEAADTSIFKISPVLTGTEFYVVFASVGYVCLILSRPVFLLALPLLALGYGASVLGMRFSMYATPILAFGFVYLLFVINRFLPYKAVPILGTLSGIAVMLYNILTVNSTLAPCFFKKDDVLALREFSNINTKDDLIYSWWDYGWPLWYYLGTNNTLVDNGRHGSDSYLIARLLMSSNQNFVANAMRYFSEKNQEGRSRHIYEVLPYVIKTENLHDILQELNYNIPTSQRGRGTYFMLHRDMLLTFGTIENFANTDLKNGTGSRHSELYISDLLQPYAAQSPIIYGDTFTFDLRNGVMQGNNGAKAVIHGVIVSENGRIKAAKQYNKNATHILIIYNKTKAIYLDMNAFNTFLVQTLLLDKYDSALFEKIVQTPRFKILKLNI